MTARAQPEGRSIPFHNLAHEFVTDEIVYLVEPVESDVRKSGLSNSKRYFNAQEWFKISLHIHTNGDLGEYVATVMPAFGRVVSPLNDAWYGGHRNLLRHQMQTLVLESIVESGKKGERVSIRGLPSMVRLYVVDQFPNGRMHALNTSVVDSNAVAARLRGADGEAALVADFLSVGENARTDRVIEYGAEVVDGLIGEQENLRWAINILKGIKVACSIGIYLTTEGPLITRLETLNDSAQMAQVFTCPAHLEEEPVWRGIGGYSCSHGQEDAEDPKGLRDSDTDARRVLRESKEDSQAAEALNSEGPPEEVASQTAQARRRGGYSAKRTRLGTSEDA